MRNFDLTPLFRSTVGFDRFSDMIDAAMRGEDNAPSYPPYNIEKLSGDTYRIVIAVAGFTAEDLHISMQENQLTVSGRHTEKTDSKDAQFLYKGIATRAFERKFNLADHVKVGDASLEHGLLTIKLTRELPEAVKPRTIPINGKVSKTIEAKPH